MPDSSLFLYYANFITDYNMKTLPLLFFTFFLATGCSGTKKDSAAQPDNGEETAETAIQPAAPVWYEGKKPIFFNVEENYLETNPPERSLRCVVYTTGDQRQYASKANRDMRGQRIFAD